MVALRLFLSPSESLTRIDGLAFEAQSRVLYFTDLGRDVVGIMNPVTSFQKVLIHDGISRPRAIVLDPDNGYLFIYLFLFE